MTEIMTFPCDFPIKVFGLSSVNLDIRIMEIVQRHVPELDQSALTCRMSRTGKYTAVTVMITAESKAQLDAIYQDLTDCPDITMSL